MISRHLEVLPKKSPVIRTLLWTFITPRPERQKLLEWDNRILREFASAWAERLLYLDYGEARQDPSNCLRDRLNLAAAATLAYRGMSASSVSEMEEMVKPLMI